MNKKLFLLPFLSLSLLIGCGKKGGDNPPPEKDIWELDEVEGESTIAEVKAGEAGQYYTVRGTVIANSGSTLGIYRKGQFLYCYNFNADPANNGGQENLKAHPLGSYVEIHAQSSTHGGAVQLTAYDVGTDKTDKKYDRAASLEVLATQGETVAPVEITKPEDFTNAEGAGKLMKFSFVPDKDYTLKDESTDQYINGTICETKTNLKLEKYCDAAVRTALLANNTTTFDDHATYEVIAFGAATTDGPARGVLCEGSSWRKTADAHFDDPTSVILEAPDEATSVEAGKTLQLQFMVMPKTAKQEVTWTSSNDEVASVSSSGLVTGVAASATPVTITAATVADPNVKGTYQLTVTAPAAQPLTESVKLDFSSVTETTAAEIKTADKLGTYATAGGTHLLSATCTKVYLGNGSGGAHPNANGLIKLATGSAEGSIVFVFDGLVNKVEVTYHDFYKVSTQYPTTADTMEINGVSQPNPYNENGTHELVTFNLASASDTINLVAHGRCTIVEITFSYVAA